jgi:hypothetical protein
MSSKKNKIPPKKVVTSPVRTRSVRKTLVELPGKIQTGGLQIGAALLLVAIAFILYFPSMRFGYVLDDQIVITDNAYTKQGFSGIGKLLTEESFQGYFGTTKKLVEGGRYRPLSLVTFAMEWEFFHQEKKDGQGKPVLDKNGVAIVEGNPQFSHFINILLYALSVVLMYFLLMYLFPSGGGKAAFWSVPFIASLLFVLHPLHVEAVSNIKGRDEIMALGFSLLTLFLILRSFTNKPEGGFSLSWLFSGLTFLMGILSKENAITFLAVIPLTLYFFTKASWSTIIKACMPLMVATLIYLVIRYNAVGFFTVGNEITDLMNNPFAGMTTGEKFATIFYTLWKYIQLLFYPHPLTHDYYPYAIPKLNWGDYRAFLPLLLYLGLGFLALKGMAKKSIFSYCLLFFIITLSITSNFVFPVGTFMNDRFIYMSSVAFCILVAYFSIHYLQDKGPQAGNMSLIGLLIVTLFSLGYAYKTYTRVPEWENRTTLNRSAIKVSYNSARSNLFMGTAIFEDQYLKENDFNKKKILMDSVAMFVDKALQIYPKYNSAMTMKAGYLGEYHKLGVITTGKLLNSFDSLLQNGVNLPFVAEYCGYLNNKSIQKMQNADTNIQATGLQEADMLLAFYETAYRRFNEAAGFTRNKNDYKKALQYIELASQLAPTDARLQQELATTKAAAQ